MAVFRSGSIFLPEASSVQVCWAQAAGAAAVALTAVVPTAEKRVEAANARSAEEFAVAARAHSGWAPADYSAALPAHDSTPAVDPTGPWAVDSVPACLAPAGSVVPTAQRSTPVDSSAQADQCGLRCSLDARPAYSPEVELRPDSLERCTASPLVSREQPPGL